VIGKQVRHLVRRLEISFGVQREPAPGRGEIGVMVDAGEHVEQRPLNGRGKTDAVGRDGGHVKRRRKCRQRLVLVLLVAMQVALQLDVHVGAAEHTDDPIEQSADAVPLSVERRPAGERYETVRRAFQLVERQRAFALRRAHLHARDQPAQIAIALLRLAQDGYRQGRVRLVGRVGLVGRT